MWMMPLHLHVNQKSDYMIYILEFSFSNHTHKLHDDNLLPTHLIISPSIFWIAKVCVIADFFYLFVHCTKFPNLGVYHANFPNLKGPRAPSQNCKKSLNDQY